MTYRVIDMFAGIGGFSLGLHRTGGFETIAMVEIDPYASKVLAKRFPGVPNLGDVTTAEFPDADFICAGFPCQDISNAGQRAGITGARSGLYGHVVRALRLVRPRGALLENVAALLGRGLDRVLGDLAEIGYDAEWHCIPAAAVGAPHIRDRIWIYAQPQHPDADGAGSYRAQEHVNGNSQPANQQVCLSGPLGALLANAKSGRDGWGQQLSESSEGSGDVADPECETGRRWGIQRPAESPGAVGERSPAQPLGSGEGLADTDITGLEGWSGTTISGRGSAVRYPGASSWWAVEPDVGRVAHGIPKRVDRLRCLGNAVVPQIPELIGRAILAAAA